MEGQRFGGRYELIHEIGAGGMGKVFETLDLETGAILATKLMTATGELELQALLRFQQEGAVLSTLTHPNIVTVYGTFLEERLCAIVMEKLAGRSLSRLLEQAQPTLLETKQIAVQALSALEYAHGRGIVHRDVKPDNIMVLPDGRVKVTDFGVARVAQAGTALNTATGMTIGTPLYMSPEQIEGTKVDGRSDVYSVGVVLYQMVTGRPPFEGDEPLTIAFKHVHKEPLPPRDLNGVLPPEWDAVILRALAKSPADRFQTAAAMREAVETLPTDARKVATAPLPTLTAAAARPTPLEAAAHEAQPGASQREPVAPAEKATEEAPPLVPPATRNRGHVSTRWVVGGGILGVLVLALAAFSLLRPGGSGPTKPVRVTLLAPASNRLPAFTIRNLTEARTTSVSPSGAAVRLSLLPGRYLLTMADSTTYLDPATLTVRPGGPQTIHLGSLFGEIVVRPAAGRVAVPGFDLVAASTGRTRRGVDATQAAQGIAVRPGRYILSFWPSEFVTTVRLGVHAGRLTTLDLARRFGRLTVLQLAHAPPSGFGMVDTQSPRRQTGADPQVARHGIFVPVGHYQVRFYNSDIYPDPIQVAIRPGSDTRVDLNTLFAAIRTPAVKSDYSVTYTWRVGQVTDTLQARTKSRTYYVRAGTYRLEVQSQSGTRVTTLHATLGRTTPLPAQ